jgi:hypothetical protein
MGNINNITDHDNDTGASGELNHTQAGRHTTGRFFKTKNRRDSGNKSSQFSQICKQVFPDEKDKLRKTYTAGFRESPLITEDELELKLRQSSEYELTFKSADDIRKSYMVKLISKNIWQPTQEEKKHNSIIIFDWDDTLLPTSFLTPNGLFTEETMIDDRDLDKIRSLETNVYRILDQAIKKGDTFIITNAAPGWVEYSTRKFYPMVYKLLKHINIVSARGEFEKIHPGDSRQWKIQAFLDMLKNMDINLITNLICLGDSIIEMEAAHILASRFTHAYIKTVKFRESPKPEELLKQLGLVIDQFDRIYSAIKNLTIKVDKKPRKKDN